jgi:hypothetical protein
MRRWWFPGSIVPSCRRTLGVVLVLAVTVTGCGGGVGPIAPVHTSSPGSPSVPASETTMQAGTVVLPAGVTLALTSLTVRNSVSSATPKADGTFSIRAYTGGAQFATVADQKGRFLARGPMMESSSKIRGRALFASAFAAGALRVATLCTGQAVASTLVHTTSTRANCSVCLPSRPRSRNR